MPDNAWLRSGLAVLGGVIVAGLVVAVVEMAGHAIFPPPAGLDATTTGDQARLMAAMPLAAKISVVVAWFLGALAGAVLAIAISRRVLPAWIVALVIAGLGLATTQMFPHPEWMVGSAVVLPLIAVMVAKAAMRGRLPT